MIENTKVNSVHNKKVRIFQDRFLSLKSCLFTFQNRIGKFTCVFPVDYNVQIMCVGLPLFTLKLYVQIFT